MLMLPVVLQEAENLEVDSEVDTKTFPKTEDVQHHFLKFDLPFAPQSSIRHVSRSLVAPVAKNRLRRLNRVNLHIFTKKLC